MKHLTFVLIVLLSFVSCRKDPKIIQPDPPIVGFDIPNTPGSWWKYDWYRIDSLGNETLLEEKDCLYVVQDTIINGNTYIHMQGDFFIYNEYDWFWRDSAEFVVHENGMRRFSTGTSQDTFNISLGMQNTFTLTKGLKHSKSVPAGTFNTHETQQHFYYSDGTPFTDCADKWVKHEHFADGIGLVSGQTGYISWIKTYCGYDEYRLTEYFIAP